MTHSCEFENFSSKVFKDSCDIDGSLGSNTHLVLGVILQESLDTTAGELENATVSRYCRFECALELELGNPQGLLASGKFCFA